MAGPLTLQQQVAAMPLAAGTRSTSGAVSGSDSVGWSRGSSEANSEIFVFPGRMAQVIGCRVVEDPSQKACTSSSKAAKRPSAPRPQPRPMHPRAKNAAIASHAAAVAASKASTFAFLRGKQPFVGAAGNVTQICTYEGTLEDYLQMRSTDASSCSEGCSSAVSERGTSSDKVTSRHSSAELPCRDSSEAISSRHSSAANSEKDETDATRSRKSSEEADSRLSSSRAKSGRSELDFSETQQQDVVTDQQCGAEEEPTEQQEQNGASGLRRGKLIELKMENGCVVWPTDRPVIPLPYWQFSGYANEPLTPQQWAQLPIVGSASPYAQLLDPSYSPVGTQPDFEVRHAYAPGTRRSSRRGLSTPPLFSPPLNGPLPRIKLPVGTEAPPLSMFLGPVPTNESPNYAAPPAETAGRHGVQRCNSFAGRPILSRLAGPPTESGSMFTAFHNQLFVRHTPSNGEGEVLRTEDEGASFVVRLRNGRIKKFPRSDCRVIKAVCTPTKGPSERALTAASHQHAMTMMLNQQTGLASALTIGTVPGPQSSMSLAQLGTRSLNASVTSATRAPLPSGSQGESDRKRGSLFELLKFRKNNVPPPIHTKSNTGPQPKVPIHPTMRGAEQVPAIEEVLQLAQGKGAAPNTVPLACAVSEPRIRAVDDQTSVETIRLKKYTIEEGQEEGNFVPVFSPECEELQTEASEQRQRQDCQLLSQDPKQLLLDRHRALEEMERRQQQREEEEVIYAQDAPEATRAPGIAPPTIIKESLVVVPPRDEEDDVSRLVQAPGIVLPCISEPPKMEIRRPSQARADATKSLVYQLSSNSTQTTDDSGIAWYSGLQQQFKDQLLKQYAATGSLQAATAAVTGAGFPLPETVVPFPFSSLGTPQVNRKQAKVLRDEADKIELQPIA